MLSICLPSSHFPHLGYNHLGHLSTPKDLALNISVEQLRLLTTFLLAPGLGVAFLFALLALGWLGGIYRAIIDSLGLSSPSSDMQYAEMALFVATVVVVVLAAMVASYFVLPWESIGQALR
jgi:hypothetical protein